MQKVAKELLGMAAWPEVAARLRAQVRVVNQLLEVLCTLCGEAKHPSSGALLLQLWSFFEKGGN